MVVRRIMLLLMLSVLPLAACTTSLAQQDTLYIALLAPFEGRYREIGYDFFYAGRLALQEANINHIKMLAVDDGGSIELASQRAQALVKNPAVIGVITGGYVATSPQVQQALDGLPVLVVGHWGIERTGNNVFVLANEETSDRVELPAQISVEDAAQLDAPFTGNEIVALKQYPLLREDLSDIDVLLSAQPPDEAFLENYMQLGQFVDEPGALVTLVYDAFDLMLTTILDGEISRDLVRIRLEITTFEASNGVIAFDNGFWLDAPMYRYEYSDGQLTLSE